MGNAITTIQLSVKNEHFARRSHGETCSGDLTVSFNLFNSFCHQMREPFGSFLIKSRIKKPHPVLHKKPAINIRQKKIQSPPHPLPVFFQADFGTMG